MSGALSGKVWIENFVLSCARKYGSKFAKPTEQKGYRVQLIEFLTRRTPEQPGAVIWALASDGQYYIPVKFATNAVKQFRGVDGKVAVLEDYWCGIFILKGTFTLQYYKIPRKYINGKPSGLEEVNKLYLEVTHVNYVGSMHEPIFVRPRILKREGMTDFVIQEEAVESVGNVAAVKRWMESLEKGDGDILKREWGTQHVAEVAAKPTNTEQQLLFVGGVTTPRHPKLLPSVNKGQEINFCPPGHWPLFWKQTFNEHPRLFDSSSSEGSGDEYYFQEGDADARHEILVPILPTDEPLGCSVEKKVLDHPLARGPSIPVPAISPVVPSTPLSYSSPSLILTDWAPTPPHRLRTRSSNMEDATRSPDETTQGSPELHGKANTSMTPGDGSPCFFEQGNTTTSLAQSSTDNGLFLEVNEEVLVPSSSQERRLSPRRAQAHRAESRTEYSTSHTIQMHPTKRNPAPEPFPPPQPLLSQPRTTSTQGLFSASVGVGVEETSQEITSSDSIRIPPGQMPVAHESQESRPTLKSTAPGSSLDAFMGGLSWGMTASESIGFTLSGQIVVTRESQEAILSQNTGEADVSFKASDPLANRDHRWKSNINAMLSSSPISATPSAPNSPAAETSIGPMNSVSPSSDGDIAYHQYIEDSRRGEEREGSPASCEERMGSQSEIGELDCASSTSTVDESGESDETDKQEGPGKQSGAMASEEEHSKKLTCDVEVDKQHKLSQGVLEEQKADLSPGPEIPLTQPQESADIEAHEETKLDDTTAERYEADNCGGAGIGRMSPPETCETGLHAKTAREELQDTILQQNSLRTHSHSSIAKTVSTLLHQPEPPAPKAQIPRRISWHLAQSDSRGPSAGQVLGKRKRISVGDDVREKAGTPPPFSSINMSMKKVNLVEILPRPPVQHQDVKRRKVEFVDAPLMIEFEESGSDLDEMPMANLGLKKKRNGLAPAIQVRDGSPFSCNKPPHLPSFAIPSPGERKLQSSRSTLHVHQPALYVVPSTSVRDELLMTPLVHRPHRVSAHSDKQQQHPTYRVSSRASARYPSPVTSSFRDHPSLGRRQSRVPRHSLPYIDHSDSSEFRDDVSIITTNTLPHVDFLKRKPVPKRRSSSSQSLQR